MANRPLQYILKLRKLKMRDKNNNEEVQIAVATGRERVDFRTLCNAVAKNTTFSPQEVGAVINQAIYTARDFVTNGDTVEFGDMGTLIPSFKSKAVPKGTKFNPKEHILKPILRLVLSKKYFELNDVSYERVAKPAKP